MQRNTNNNTTLGLKEMKLERSVLDSTNNDIEPWYLNDPTTFK